MAIHGQSFAKAAILENLAIGYPKAVAGCVNIGLLHTGLNGMDGHDRYAPCSIDDLRSKGYDYWALGHVHSRQVPCNDPPIVFPGNAQGRHVRETGEKGCLLVSIAANGRVDREFHRLDALRWEVALVDVTDLNDESDVLDLATAVFDDLLRSDSDPEHPVAIRVQLRGATSLDGRLRARSERWINEIRGLTQFGGRDRIWIEKVDFQTRPIRGVPFPDGPIDEIYEVLEQFRAEPSALAPEFVELKRKLSAVLKQEADEFRLGDSERIRELLDEVQPILFDILQSTERSNVS
ncbi:MAG: hypothetical protein NVSMB14_04420 [Isosphaeraceae bacterium]